jgi:hypothetical protein
MHASAGCLPLFGCEKGHTAASSRLSQWGMIRVVADSLSACRPFGECFARLGDNCGYSCTDSGVIACRSSADHENRGDICTGAHFRSIVDLDFQLQLCYRGRCFNVRGVVTCCTCSVLTVQYGRRWLKFSLTINSIILVSTPGERFRQICPRNPIRIPTTEYTDVISSRSKG